MSSPSAKIIANEKLNEVQGEKAEEILLPPTNGTIIADETESQDEVSNAAPIIYETLYKKGGIKGEFRFYHAGDLFSAVRAVKEFLNKRHLIHIHTMKHVIDLEGDLEEQTKMGL